MTAAVSIQIAQRPEFNSKASKRRKSASGKPRKSKASGDACSDLAETLQAESSQTESSQTESSQAESTQLRHDGSIDSSLSRLLTEATDGSLADSNRLAGRSSGERQRRLPVVLDMSTGGDPVRTFANPELEHDFIAYCQMASPVYLCESEFEAKRVELLESASSYVDLPEFASADVAQVICGSTLLEPLETVVEVERWTEVGAMFANLCSTRLLTADEERAVLRRLHYYKFLAFQILMAETMDQWALARAEGLLRAAHWHRSLVIQSNMRLVVSIVKKLPVSPTNYDELVSDGIVALLRAIDKFDPSRGYRFCTYATPVIRRECFQHMQERQTERTRFGQSAALSILSSVGGLSDGKADRAHWIAWRKKLMSMIEHLSRREQVIIRSRYCLGAHKHVKTLQRLADALKISKERVRQLERTALNKLRKLAETQKSPSK
ncbi:MAG: sigma-70 family RNA polymerase sigma factor [Pirellulaceae bacterium]|nr:sigma-70 family RNA polymerase sigma factor [Pirellulaceae bacterium]